MIEAAAALALALLAGVLSCLLVPTILPYYLTSWGAGLVWAIWASWLAAWVW